MRLRLHAAAAIILAAAVNLIPTPALADDSTVSWGVRPADNAHGSGRPNYNYALQPGDRITDAFVISNNDELPLTFRVYAADGFVSASGQLDLLRADQISVDIGSWIEVETGELTIAPGQSAEVPFILTVPQNATPGDHTGGIVSSLVVDNTGATIAVERRLGSRIHLRVAGELAPALQIENLTVRHPGSTDLLGRADATIRFTVVNTGNARMTGDLVIDLSGPFGWFGRSAEAPELPELLPGSSHEIQVEVADVVASVRVTATVTVTPVVAQPDLVPPPDPVIAEASAWALPWLPLGLLVLVLVWLVVWWVRRHRRRAGPSPSGSGVGLVDQQASDVPG